MITLSNYEKKLISSAIEYGKCYGTDSISNNTLLYHAAIVASSLYYDCEEKNPVAIKTLEDIKREARVEIEGYNERGLEYKEYIDAGIVIVSKYINLYQSISAN